MQQTYDRLYRSRRDQMIGGVCGGLGEYFNVDSTLLRLVFALSFLFFGFGPLIYVVMWIVVPQEPAGALQGYQPPVLPAEQPAPAPPVQDPTGEWRYDPYTGEPIKKEEQQPG